MLLNKTGSAAQAQFAGLENNYEEAMKRLKAFYGDPRRLSRVIAEDLAKQGNIKYSDFRGLIDYAGKIESHYSRLKAMKMEKEMDNSTSMNSILGKLPLDVKKDWVVHLGTIDTEKLKLEGEFECLIDWMKVKKVSWE